MMLKTELSNYASVEIPHTSWVLEFNVIRPRSRSGRSSGQPTKTAWAEGLGLNFTMGLLQSNVPFRGVNMKNRKRG